MGYTTVFEGEFACRHLEAEGVGHFLRALHAGNQDVVGPMADWLLERADPRGERIAELLQRGDPSAVWKLFGLRPEHAAYLNAFSDTRRMRRDPEKARLFPDPHREAVRLPIGTEAAYFVGGNRSYPQDHDHSVLDYNAPPEGQPGLWCKWAPNADATAIVWNGAEKFYDYVEWLQYLIAHFLAPWGYVLNGDMRWQGEAQDDRGILIVNENQVEAFPDA